jgi:hypothetical protein
VRYIKKGPLKLAEENMAIYPKTVQLILNVTNLKEIKAL